MCIQNVLLSRTIHCSWHCCCCFILRTKQNTYYTSFTNNNNWNLFSNFVLLRLFPAKLLIETFLLHANKIVRNCGTRRQEIFINKFFQTSRSHNFLKGNFPLSLTYVRAKPNGSFHQTINLISACICVCRFFIIKQITNSVCSTFAIRAIIIADISLFCEHRRKYQFLRQHNEFTNVMQYVTIIDNFIKR